ncbi:MAG TPA: diaminopimelate decarboxylase [Bacteroidota bacterium]|nr:diaminopimelate decarboxylase [Bacteroidota bacterium]
MQEFAYSGATLMAEGAALREVAEEFGTPLYVYSKRSLLDHCRHIEQAFDGYPHLSYYAVKANANRELLRLIGREGFGADVGSVGELHAALSAGIHAAKITFSGVGKRDDELRSALRSGIHAYNVESTEEIDVLSAIAVEEKKKARILLRVNLDIDAGGHAYVSTSLKQNKFGIPSREAGRVLRWAMGLPGIEVTGLHSHIGSQITKAETFVRAAEALVQLLRELRGGGIPLADLDFGGGFGVQYRGYVRDPRLPEEEPEEMNLSAATLIRTVAPLLRETDCRLSIQPGRSVIAHAGVLLVKVLYRKQSEEKQFIVVDGGMNDLIRPSLYNAYHQIVPLELAGRAVETADIVGPLCESGDFFALDRRIPRVERGEYLALMCAGAYGYVLASNYNARPRPAEVLVDGKTRTVIRKRETIQDINEG